MWGVLLAVACHRSGEAPGDSEPSVDCAEYPARIDGGDGYPTIQAAIDASTDGATILLCDGTHYEALHIDRSVSLIGTGSAKVIVDAGDSGSGLSIEDGDVSIQGMAIRNGRAGQGGAVFSRAHTLSLTDVVLASSTATTAGGGLFAEGGATTLERVTIEGNRAKIGGGIMIDGGTLVTDRLTARDNAAAGSTLEGENVGGGLAAVDANVRITSSSFESNTAWRGGGIYVVGGAATIESSVLTMNTITLGVFSAVPVGGGLYAEDAELSLVQSTLSSNEGYRAPAAILLGGTLAASQVLVVDNVAETSGVFILDNLVGSLVDSEIAGNTADDNYVAPAGLDVWSSTLDLSDTVIHDNVGGIGGLQVHAPSTITGGEVSTNVSLTYTCGVLISENVYVPNGAVTITGMSIVGNTVDGPWVAGASGMNIETASTVLNEVVIRGNVDDEAGAVGIVLLSGELTLNQSMIEGHAGGVAGGAVVGGGTTLRSNGTYWHDNTPSDVWVARAKKAYSYNGWVTFECSDAGCS